MACKRGFKLEDIHKRTLGALKGSDAPLACKDIAAAAGLKSSQVSCRMRPLKSRGYLESPEKGKYVVTDEGLGEI